MMMPMLDYMAKTKKPMLGKFGVGFKRDMLIEEYGARPVIYCDFLGKFDIGENNHWLCEELDIQKHDFQWLREWRIKDNFDFSKVDRNNIVIVVENKNDIDTCGVYVDNIVSHYDNGKIYDADFDVKCLYRCIALDELKKEIKDNILGDYELKAIIEMQEIDKIVEL